MTQKKSLAGKTQGIWKLCQNTGKTQQIWFAQFVNSLVLKVKDILKFAVKISNFFFKLDKVSFVYKKVTNHVIWHRENLPTDREKTGKTQGI